MTTTVHDLALGRERISVEEVYNKAKRILYFIDLANLYGLDCILETHNEEELSRAIDIGFPIIGINNRDLKNLSTDISNTLKLIKKIPKEFIVVAESGIKSKKDINNYNDAGIYNFLIGESILKSQNITKKINEFLN